MTIGPSHGAGERELTGIAKTKHVSFSEHQRKTAEVTALESRQNQCNVALRGPKTPPIYAVFGPFDSYPPQTLYSHFVRKKQLASFPAGFRNMVYNIFARHTL